MRLRTVGELALLVHTQRKRQGLSMQDVDDEVGCSRQWIAALEQGRERLEIALALPSPPCALPIPSEKP